MIRPFLLLLLLFQLICPTASSADGGNPFHGATISEQTVQTSSSHKSLLTKIALYQQRLKQKMVSLIRQVNTAGNMYPLLAVVLIAFTYGAVHAAGPGHGKAVAMSYILSRNPSIVNGVLLGTLIAFFHGLSGALCVIGLRYVLNKSITGTLATVSQVTQVTSFALITILGIIILVKNGRDFFLKRKARLIRSGSDVNDRKKRLLPLAVAVGLVPCPAVVMVMLFCLAQDAMILGLLLAMSISCGMAVTISLFVIAVVWGKTGILNAVTEERTEVIEIVVGILSGTAVSLLGALFLLTALYTAAF
ncbi:MAG: hypothetical protein JW902_05980 [Syntrophaceae bacterium]|nr:hypothetical protein [Syntrophaceae bacterium]